MCYQNVFSTSCKVAIKLAYFLLNSVSKHSISVMKMFHSDRLAFTGLLLTTFMIGSDAAAAKPPKDVILKIGDPHVHLNGRRVMCSL